MAVCGLPPESKQGVVSLKSRSGFGENSGSLPFLKDPNEGIGKNWGHSCGNNCNRHMRPATGFPLPYSTMNAPLNIFLMTLGVNSNQVMLGQ